LREIFALAQAAPSTCNVQPWTVHVVSGAATERLRAALVEASATAAPSLDYPFVGVYQGIYRERQSDSARTLYDAMGIAREDRAGRMAAFIRNYSMFDAPHAAFICMDESFGVREAADCGMYAQTLMLAMTAHGIASCPQMALGMYADTVRRQLGFPAGSKILFGISFGYEDTAVAANAARVGRCPLSEIVTFHD
jgi:nitroreductase